MSMTQDLCPLLHSLLIDEYYGDPRQSFGHSHGAKHVRKVPVYVGWSESCGDLNT